MGGGWPALKKMDKAQSNRWLAKFLRTDAGKYSTEHSSVQKKYELADKLDKEAEYLERSAAED